MKNPFTKLAAAAVTIIVVTLSVTIWDNTISKAYALEQTIKASHSVRYLYIKAYNKGMEEPKEFWIEFDEQGRSNLPKFRGKQAKQPQTAPRFHVKKLVERLYFPHIQLIDGEIYLAHKKQQLTVSVKRLNTLLSLSLKDLHAQGNCGRHDGAGTRL